MHSLPVTRVTLETEKAFNSWMQSSEARSHCQAPLPERGEVGRVWEIPVTFSGVMVTVYKVCRHLYPFREAMGYWDVTLSASEALEWCSNSLWLAADSTKPEIEIPEYTNPAASVPPIVKFQYGNCPFTGDPLVKYGVLKTQMGGPFPWYWYFKQVWMATRDEAELERQGSISDLDELRQSIAARAENEALMREAELLSSQWKPFLLQRLSGMKEDLHQLLGMNPYAPMRKVLDPETTAVHAYNARLRTALNEWKTAYDKAHEMHTRAVREHQVVDRLRAAFKTVTVCPLCNELLTFTNEWLGELALIGSAQLLCACAGYHEDPYLTSIPETTVEGINLQVTHVILDGDAHLLTIGGTHASRVIVHFEALCASDLKNLVCRDFAREHIEASKKLKAEKAEIGVQIGTVLLLRFRFDHRRSRWSTKKIVNGKTVVYSVDSRSGREVVPDAEYYCRIVSTPQSARKPDFELVIVDPYLEKK